VRLKKARPGQPGLALFLRAGGGYFFARRAKDFRAACHFGILGVAHSVAFRVTVGSDGAVWLTVFACVTYGFARPSGDMACAAPIFTGLSV